MTYLLSYLLLSTFLFYLLVLQLFISVSVCTGYFYILVTMIPDKDNLQEEKLILLPSLKRLSAHRGTEGMVEQQGSWQPEQHQGLFTS